MLGELFCGDNLEVMAEYLAPSSVDLVYLDPPFNSQRTYNIVYKDSHAQEEAFKDYWSWSESASTYERLATSGETPKSLRSILRALHDFLVEADSDQLAYLTMMTARLLALHRVLKPTGSLYLHCDPTASHYLKMLLDAIFGGDRFLAEIVWKRYGAHGNSTRYGAVHDVILFYGKGPTVTFNKQFVPYAEDYARDRFRLVDENGRRYQEQNLSNPSSRPNLYYPYKASNGITYYPHRNGWKCDLDRMKQLDEEGRLHFPKDPKGRLRMKMFLDECEGVPVQDVWTDIVLPSSSKERLGYPTQKPVALLERIVKASSNEGDLVLDPFCGCGTTIEACERLGRRWIGIDIAHKAIDVIEERFEKLGLDAPPVTWHPFDAQAARALASHPKGKRQFEEWVRRKLRAKKRDKDRGIDGEATFRDDSGKLWHVIVSVKGGKLKPTDLRDLRGTIEREGAEIGALVSIEKPKKEMGIEAARAGFLPVSDADGPIPRLQLVVVDEEFFKRYPIRVRGTNVTEMPREDGAQLKLPLNPGRAAVRARPRPVVRNARASNAPAARRPSSKPPKK